MSEQKNDTQNQVAAPAAPAEAPAPKLASGLFQSFKLGSTLEQAAHGNVMHGLKQSPMDYVKRADNHKNQAVNPEELAKLDPKELDEGGVEKSKFKEVSAAIQRKEGYSKERADAITAAAGRKKLGEKEMERRSEEGRAKKSLSDEEIAAVPAEHRELILAELDRKIEEAKKSNDAAEAERIEKAKEKAKKCWAPTMEYKQPKSV